MLEAEEVNFIVRSIIYVVQFLVQIVIINTSIKYRHHRYTSTTIF